MDSIKYSTGFINSEGVQIFYRHFGIQNKTPILIVHGLSYFSYDWIEVANSLSFDREVVAIDMRGFGDSDWPGEYSIQAMSNDLFQVVKSMNWNSAILIGHSMGGRSCSLTTLNNTALIEKLILVDFTPDNAPPGSKRVAQTVSTTPDQFESVEKAMQWFGEDPHSPQGFLQKNRYEAYLKKVNQHFVIKRDPFFKNQFIEQIKTGVRHPIGVDLWEVLSTIQQPIKIIRGKESDMFAEETKDKLFKLCPKISLVEVNSGHNIAGENPKDLIKEIQSFL